MFNQSMITNKHNSNHQFLLVEPIAKTEYPPLGLMKISSMLKDKYKGCEVFPQIGAGRPTGLNSPKKIFITSLFTWHWKHLLDTIHYYKFMFPNTEIIVGGISATLLCNELCSIPGVIPQVGIYREAEFYPPDYSITFNRNIRYSITFTSRGCKRKCSFCSVTQLEPDFFTKDDWQKDICEEYPHIIFWDNNFLQSPNFEKDCEKIVKFNKKVDFNQGLDARLLDKDKAKLLFKINIDPVRFAFDNIHDERDVLRGIRLAKKFTNKEIAVYVLYNFNDTPEELYYRINLLNREGVLSFPMEYRRPSSNPRRLPGRNWNTFLSRAFKLTLLFYYRKGTITGKRESFKRIYGNNEKQFIEKLYAIYRYDKALKRTK